MNRSAEGIIEKVKLDGHGGGFGFIAIPGDASVFFHASALDLEIEFDEMLTGRRVRVDYHMGQKGPKASFVRAAD